MTETITFRIKRNDLRNQAHFFFDAIWKNDLMSRDKAYIYLSEKLEISLRLCHFSRLRRKELISSIKICIDYLNQAYTLHDLPNYKY